MKLSAICRATRFSSAFAPLPDSQQWMVSTGSYQIPKFVLCSCCSMYTLHVVGEISDSFPPFTRRRFASFSATFCKWTTVVKCCCWWKSAHGLQYFVHAVDEERWSNFALHKYYKNTKYYRGLHMARGTNVESLWSQISLIHEGTINQTNVLWWCDIQGCKIYSDSTTCRGWTHYWQGRR